MKKFLCVALIALLCFSATAMADMIPSKSTADMVATKVEGANIPADAGFVLAPVVDEVKHAAQIAACKDEIAKLSASASVEEYFGEVKDINGNVVSLKELLNVETLNVYEFMPLIVENYDVTYGNVKVEFSFSTPYATDEKVAVLIGVPNAETSEIEWVALEGIGTGVNGAIEVEFTPEVLEAIQNGNAMMTVVSM